MRTQFGLFWHNIKANLTNVIPAAIITDWIITSFLFFTAYVKSIYQQQTLWQEVVNYSYFSIYFMLLLPCSIPLMFLAQVERPLKWFKTYVYVFFFFFVTLYFCGFY